MQLVSRGLSHPIGFQLPSVGARVVYGATQKVLSDAYIKVRKLSWGKWEVLFTPVCGGTHKLWIFIIGFGTSTSNHTIKVTGRPWINARVARGPDYGEPQPPTNSKGQAVKTSGCYHDHKNITGEGRVRNSYYPLGRYPNMILVEWDVGGSCCTSRWGVHNHYDIELVL